MLINSSNTGKERKETGFFHWLEKMASGQVTKKKKNRKSLRKKRLFISYLKYIFRNTLLKSTTIKVDISEGNVACHFSELHTDFNALTTFDSSNWGIFLFST